MRYLFKIIKEETFLNLELKNFQGAPTIYMRKIWVKKELS